VGPRAGVDKCGKSRLPPGFDPRTVQPTASRYIPLRYPAHMEQSDPSYLIVATKYKHVCIRSMSVGFHQVNDYEVFNVRYTDR